MKFRCPNCKSEGGTIRIIAPCSFTIDENGNMELVEGQESVHIGDVAGPIEADCQECDTRVQWRLAMAWA